MLNLNKHTKTTRFVQLARWRYRKHSLPSQTVSGSSVTLTTRNCNKGWQTATEHNIGTFFFCFPVCLSVSSTIIQNVDLDFREVWKEYRPWTRKDLTRFWKCKVTFRGLGLGLTHLLLACNDMWRGGGIHSTVCTLVFDSLFVFFVHRDLWAWKYDFADYRGRG